MTDTVQDLINSAARLCRVKGRGRALTGEESAEWLAVLNDMIESWAIDNLLIYGSTVESFTLTSSAQSYTIGSAGDFNTTRPQEILNMFIRAGNTDYPVELITESEYNRISNKNVSARPSRAWYNPTYTLGRIYFESKPAIGEEVHIDSLKEISQFATLATALSLPPGYRALIKFNLAIEGANEFGRSVLPETAKRADDLMKLAKRRNKRTPVLTVDQALVNQNGFNIISGGSS